MPAVGDQHKANAATTNPFEEVKPRLSEYTAQEIATLQSRLDKQLGPEYISSRPGAAGQKVHYLAAEKVINLANEIFGFNGWSSGIQNIQIDFVDENVQTGKISLGLSVIVRVTLKDGTYHEDVGYGHIENCKGKAAAFEKAKKEGTTDALKRALRTFGNVLGNCVYDKDYVAKVTKVKVGAGKWNIDALHRHPDFMPKKEQDLKPFEPPPVSDGSSLAQLEESFGMDDFDDAEFDDSVFNNPDEIILPAEPVRAKGTFTSADNQQSMRQPAINGTATPSRQPNASSAVPKPPQQAAQNGNPLTGGSSNSTSVSSGSNYVVDQLHNSGVAPSPSSPGVSSQSSVTLIRNHGGAADAHNIARPSGFYSARAAEKVDAENNVAATGPQAVPLFNPHAESPSIRKTAGVDHRKSVPLKRDLKPDTTPIIRDSIDPRTEQNRRVGPQGQSGQSPMIGKGQNTSAYRPPTRRGTDQNVAGNTNTAGSAGRDLAAAKRSPLVDVSNVQHNVTANTIDGAEAKRQRLVGPGDPHITGGENALNEDGN